MLWLATEWMYKRVSIMGTQGLTNTSLGCAKASMGTSNNDSSNKRIILVIHSQGPAVKNPWISIFLIYTLLNSHIHTYDNNMFTPLNLYIDKCRHCDNCASKNFLHVYITYNRVGPAVSILENMSTHTYTCSDLTVLARPRCWHMCDCGAVSQGAHCTVTGH